MASGGRYIWFTCGITHREIDSVELPGHDRPTSNWWLHDYVKPCQKAVEKKPLGKMVKTDELMARAIELGKHCSMCSPKNFVDLKAFGNVFGEEIDKSVAMVLVGATVSTKFSLTYNHGVAQENLGLSWDAQVPEE